MKALVKTDFVENRIFTVREKQIMLDEDLAYLFGIETKVLNQAVKRNIERFPEEFMFQLTDNEYKFLRSQNVTLEKKGFLRSQSVTLDNKRGKYRKYLPYVFTEHGVTMLSTVLKSETAVKMSVQIINAFVYMRRFILSNAQVFQRIENLETKQIQTDNKIDKVLSAIENKSIQLKQGVFYEGQVFDAWQFASNLIKRAKKSIILIDNYIDDSVLTLFSKREKSVSVTILTKNINNQLEIDVRKFNEQYPPILLKQFNLSHDRFIIIDKIELYHIGASLKDLGKKWFAFSKMEFGLDEMLKKVKLDDKF